MTSLKENLSPINIFRPSLWFCQTLCEVYLRQPNTTHAKSKLVRQHTLSVHACSIVCRLNWLTSTLGQVIWLKRQRFLVCNVATHLGSQLTRPTYLDVIPSPRMSSAIEVHSIMPIKNGPMFRSYHLDILNIHPSRFYRGIGPFHVHVISFTDSVSNSRCIYSLARPIV